MRSPMASGRRALFTSTSTPPSRTRAAMASFAHRKIRAVGDGEDETVERLHLVE